MAQKIKQNAKELQEERELQEFIEARAKARKSLAKRILIAVVCIALVLCFCLPSLAGLFA